jgi:DnaK suppressor protein
VSGEEKNKKMTTELEKIKADLQERKQKLEQDMNVLNKEKFSDDQVQDVGDQALSSTMETLRSSLQDSKFEEYRMIVKALGMIEEGTYGICVDCQLPISTRRLQSYPNATRCLGCQELFEERRS